MMVHFGRHDPGECVICGAAHCACGGGTPEIILQLPARDATVAPSTSALGDGSGDGRPFSTSTYRGLKRRR